MKLIISNVYASEVERPILKNKEKIMIKYSIS